MTKSKVEICCLQSILQNYLELIYLKLNRVCYPCLPIYIQIAARCGIIRIPPASCIALNFHNFPEVKLDIFTKLVRQIICKKKGFKDC